MTQMWLDHGKRNISFTFFFALIMMIKHYARLYLTSYILCDFFHSYSDIILVLPSLVSNFIGGTSVDI